MGTWGSGTFQSDGARDFLNDLQDSLTNRIETVLADPVAVELDEQGEDVFMPAVEILTRLCESYGGIIPELATVQRWRDTYLRVFDAYIPKLAGPGYAQRRRKVIEETFARLEKLAIKNEAA
jgi:hypothetical protein